MRRRLFLAFAVPVVLGQSGCTPLRALSDGYLDIDQAELQARLQSRFPQHHCKGVVACVELSNPVVVLKEGEDRIGFEADVKVSIAGRERTGRVGLSGQPRYVQDPGQIFLDDPEITTLAFAGLPQDYADLVRSGATLVARRALESHPIYTLDSKTAKGALAKRAIADIKVLDGKLRISFAGSGG